MKSKEYLKQKINLMYDSGKTMIEISKELRVAKKTVEKYVDKPRCAGPKVEMEQDRIIEINKLYNSGAIMDDLAKKYNVSAPTICRYIWKPRNKGTRRINNISKVSVRG